MLDSSMPFSCHVTLDGALVLYLEEHDAVLDLLEDVVTEVTMTDLNELRQLSKVSNLRNIEDCKKLDSFRAAFPSTVVRLVRMTEDEALNLAQMIVDQVRIKRAMENKPLSAQLRIVQ